HRFPRLSQMSDQRMIQSAFLPGWATHRSMSNRPRGTSYAAGGQSRSKKSQAEETPMAQWIRFERGDRIEFGTGRRDHRAQGRHVCRGFAHALDDIRSEIWLKA